MQVISTSEVFNFQDPHTVLGSVMHKGASHLLGMPLQLSLKFCHTSCILLLHKHAPAHKMSGLFNNLPLQTLTFDMFEITCISTPVTPG